MKRPEDFDEDSEMDDFEYEDDASSGTTMGSAVRMAVSALFDGDGMAIYNMRHSGDPNIRKVGWIITLIILGLIGLVVLYFVF